MKKVFKIVGIIAASAILTSGVIIGYGYYCVYTVAKAVDEGSDELNRSIANKTSQEFEVDTADIQQSLVSPDVDIADDDPEAMAIANNGILRINKGNEKEIQRNCNILRQELIDSNYDWYTVYRGSSAVAYLISLLPCNPDIINVEAYLEFMSESTKETRAQLNLVDYINNNYND